MCVNNLSKAALDSAAAGIEPAISSRKSNALITTPPNHRGICTLTVTMSHNHLCNLFIVYDKNSFYHVPAAYPCALDSQSRCAIGRRKSRAS